MIELRSNAEILLKLPEDMRKELVTTDNAASHALAWAKRLNIVDPGTEERALEALASARKSKKSFEALRKFLVQPIKEHAKNIDALFKFKAAPAKEADEILNKKILAWRADQEKKRLALEKRKQDEWEAENTAARQLGGDAPDRPTPETEAPKPEIARTSAGSVSSKKIWDFELKDLSKVPDAYKQLNTAQVRQAISNGVRVIPGLEIKQRESLAVR